VIHARGLRELAERLRELARLLRSGGGAPEDALRGLTSPAALMALTRALPLPLYTRVAGAIMRLHAVPRGQADRERLAAELEEAARVLEEALGRPAGGRAG
jgi:hypothetical protein